MNFQSVSIAGAILWGVLRQVILGRSMSSALVSIAGAILWGVLPSLFSPAWSGWVVSIAGAILWGVLLITTEGAMFNQKFQSQGRFFGGCCCLGMKGFYRSSL